MMCQTEPGEFCPIFSKNAENLKMAVKNFPQTFGRYIGAHFFYFSTQIIDQLRKKPFRKVVAELRFLTQLSWSDKLFEWLLFNNPLKRKPIFLGLLVSNAM